MIIFDLDGTLADCEHRRHFVEDPTDSCYFCYHSLKNYDKEIDPTTCICSTCGRNPVTWKKNWKAFYEACDKDTIISPIRCLFDFIGMNGQSHKLNIWSGRCESVREKTEKWLRNYSFAYATREFEIELKMRPIGDYTPDDELKERWLDEALKEGKTIDFVFDDRPKVVRMWRRRGIFVFDCNQSGKEF